LLTPGVRSSVVVSCVFTIPPITVVVPSVTCTCVSARCVLMDGLPLTARLKSGSAFSSTMRMITVFAAVIWGVTTSFSAADLNCTVTVLFATI
jgi:hypothetical protein